MKDYNNYYHSKYTKLKEGLQKRFNIKVTQATDPTTVHKKKFIEKILFEKNNIIKNYSPTLPGATDYIVTKNYFKELIVKEFSTMKQAFPEDQVNGFVEQVIPDKRKLHQQKYENGDKKKYQFDPMFMYKASTEEILDLIAKYYAYEDFIEFDFPRLLKELEVLEQAEIIVDQEAEIKFEEMVDRSKKNSNYSILTQAESVLLIKSLREEHLILGERYLNNTNMAKVAYYLTGFASGPFRKKLSDPVSNYSKNQKRKLAEKLKNIVERLEQ